MQLKLSLQTVIAIVIIVLILGCSFNVFAQSEKKNGINIGLGYPVSSHGVQAKEYSNVFSLNATVGVSREEKGVSLAGLSNIVRENASGWQVAGFSNHIGQSAQGATLAGFLNTYRSGKGWQVAGFSNLAQQEVKGTQLAGFMNKAGSMHGPQIAGFMNIAKDIKGVQLAGFMNIAKNVKGVQIAGFINIADSSDYSIGIINLIKNGEKSFGISVDETQTTLASFRSGGRIMYGIIGAGYNFENSSAKYALEAGIGAHLVRGNKFRVNMELVTIQLTDFKKGQYNKVPLRVLPAFRISPRLEIYAGPTLNYVFTDTIEGKELTKRPIWESKSDRDSHSLHLGFTGGLHVIL